ncbi:MAG: hypothetical protein MMC33_008648 [Icmadophila ericetorum]|nr:hypothetical protein [Icmadophila ericetorum]
MARGNQRDKAREKNMKDQAGVQSGTEFQRTKEQQAEIMRKKQEEGQAKLTYVPAHPLQVPKLTTLGNQPTQRSKQKLVQLRNNRTRPTKNITGRKIEGQ